MQPRQAPGNTRTEMGNNSVGVDWKMVHAGRFLDGKQSTKKLSRLD